MKSLELELIPSTLILEKPVRPTIGATQLDRAKCMKRRMASYKTKTVY
jgi:hypothetical protein